MQNNVITASRQNCFQVCPRKHYWQFEVGLQRDGETKALFIGSAWHRAMDALWHGATYEMAFEAALPSGEFRADEYVTATLAGLLHAYVTHWGSEHMDVHKMETEKQFRFPLKGVKGFTVEGKIDRIGENHDGRQVQVEYKTTGESIQPKTIQDLDERGLKIVTDAAGNRIFNEKGKNAGEPRQTADKERGWTVKEHLETPDEFNTRLVIDCASRPDFYFARYEVPILESDLADFEAQRLSLAKTIQHHRKMAAKLIRPEFAWPRHVNDRNCMSCQFASFCLQNINLDLNQLPQGFAVKPFNPELHDNSSTEENIAAV